MKESNNERQQLLKMALLANASFCRLAFIDTGGFVALNVAEDAHHLEAVECRGGSTRHPL